MISQPGTGRQLQCPCSKPNHVGMQAQCEPPQLSASRMLLPPWTQVVGAVETLVHRVGTLECVLDGREPLLNAARLQHALGASPQPAGR